MDCLASRMYSSTLRRMRTNSLRWRSDEVNSGSFASASNCSAMPTRLWSSVSCSSRLSRARSPISSANCSLTRRTCRRHDAPTTSATAPTQTTRNQVVW